VSKPVPTRVRAMRVAYQEPGASLETVAERFGISKNAVWMAFCRHGLLMRMGTRRKLDRSDILTFKLANKVWCGQCEIRVAAVDAERCRSPFCKARSLLPAPAQQDVAA
jgi:hypothetical protein